MTATVFNVTGRKGIVLRSFAKVGEATAHAERLGASVTPRTFAESDGVNLKWHGWPKTGVVTGFTRATATVKFHPRAGAPAVEKQFKLTDLAEWN